MCTFQESALPWPAHCTRSLEVVENYMSINELLLFSQLCHGYKVRWMRHHWSFTLRAPCTSRRDHAPSTIVTTMLSVASTLRVHGTRHDVKSCAIIASTGAKCGLVSLRRQVFPLPRLDVIGDIELEDAGVEVQLRLKGALDVFGLAKAVLLALEGDVCDRYALFPQRL